MTKLWKIASLLLTMLLLAKAAFAEGYLNIPGIRGESQRAGHEGEIDINHVSYAVNAGEAARIGAGRVRARASFDDVVIEKRIDAATPYLALAAAQGKRFKSVEVTLRKDSGDAHLDYLTITLTNAVITGVETDIEATGDGSETVAFAFEKIAIRYIEAGDDHSAGDEHEIEYDIAAGP